VPETLGERVKMARRALGLTQAELAKPDLTKGFISLLEHDRSRPSVSTLERLAQRLKQPVSYFLGSAEADVSKKVLHVLVSRGRSELARQRYDEAFAAFQEMRQFAASRDDVAMEMHAILGIGEALLGLRRLDEARTHLDDALGRSQEAKTGLIECRALHGLATVEHRSGNFPRAASLYRAALAVVPTLDAAEPGLHGEILLYLGTVLHRMGRLEEASEALTQGQRIFEDAGLPERVGEALADNGLVSYLSGDYDGALLRLERARVLLEQYEDLRTLSWVRNNLGMVLVEMGRPREALAHLTVSLAIKQRLNDAVGECHTFTELARCHFACGEMGPAREYAERAITRSRDGGAPDEEARAQIVLGATALAEGNARKAQRYLALGAAHCERASMLAELVTSFLGLARTATLLGRHKESTMYHGKALAALRGMGPHDAAAALRHADLMGHWADPAEVPSPSS